MNNLFEHLPGKEAVKRLLSWYENNHRCLPWREAPTPYRVWISEIMLQQTRVEAVKPYFERFLQECPDVKALAAVPDETLLKLWEGLGYYSRARNLKRAAQMICAEYGGVLPSGRNELLRLPGIGSYTAGAIASIAFGLPEPAVDGNVLRVLARVTGCDADVLLPETKRAAEDAVREIIPSGSAGNFTQAMIELGALVCCPNGEAKCGICPFCDVCIAHAENKTDILPVRSKLPERKVEERTVLLLLDGNRMLIRKRPPKGLLAGLYELPNEKGSLNEEQAIAFARQNGFEPLKLEHLPEAKHIFTHLEWHMRGWLMTGYFEPGREEKKDAILADRRELDAKYAVPSAFSAYLKAAKEYIL